MQFEHQYTCETYLAHLSVKAFSAVMIALPRLCTKVRNTRVLTRKHVQAVLKSHTNITKQKNFCAPQEEVSIKEWFVCFGLRKSHSTNKLTSLGTQPLPVSILQLLFMVYLCMCVHNLSIATSN